MLGNGDNVVKLSGALNTVVLGNGDNYVNLGAATASVSIGSGSLVVNYGRLFSATFSAPQSFSNWRASSSGDIGSFNGGAGNIGAFNGLWNASATSGNNNIGVFNGLGNGGVYDGNGNVGGFNGNLNGLADSSPSDGGGNGDGNVGAFDGNFNGNFVQGTSSGNNNGLDNIGFLSGNWNGNGQAPAATPVNLLNPALELPAASTPPSSAMATIRLWRARVCRPSWPETATTTSPSAAITTQSTPATGATR